MLDALGAGRSWSEYSLASFLAARVFGDSDLVVRLGDKDERSIVAIFPLLTENGVTVLGNNVDRAIGCSISVHDSGLNISVNSVDLF